MKIRQAKKLLQKKSSLMKMRVKSNGINKLKIDTTKSIEEQVQQLSQKSIFIPRIFFRSTQTAVWVNKSLSTKKDKVIPTKAKLQSSKQKLFKQQIALKYRSEEKSHRKKIKSNHHLQKQIQKINSKFQKMRQVEGQKEFVNFISIQELRSPSKEPQNEQSSLEKRGINSERKKNKKTHFRIQKKPFSTNDDRKLRQILSRNRKFHTSGYQLKQYEPWGGEEEEKQVQLLIQ